MLVAETESCTSWKVGLTMYMHLQQIRLGHRHQISWEITTRQYGQTFAEGAMYYSANKLHSLLLHIDNQAPVEMYINWNITSIKGYSTSGIYAWHPTTNEVVALRNISRTADAQAFNINLTGSTSYPWRMFALHATTTEGNTPRT